MPSRSGTALSYTSSGLNARLAQSAAADGVSGAVALFKRCAKTVPAYAEFLSAQGICPPDVDAAKDMGGVPIMERANYIERYALPRRCRAGRLDLCDFLAVSSGSTGAPTVWPRCQADEASAADRFEQVFVHSFAADSAPTLAVVCFPMGSWVGGMYTSFCCRELAARGLPVTTVTPGNNRDEILRVLRELSGLFAQTVLLGYPPFLKDVVDWGCTNGVNWAPLNVRIVLAGEVFSEEWRTLMAQRLGGIDPCLHFASLYGTADAGVLGNETPWSIAIRRALSKRPQAAERLFGELRLPTLVQFDPVSRYIECVGGRLHISADTGVPLIRYNILDSGGVIQFDTMAEFLAKESIDPRAELALHPAREPVRLPYVYLFGRAHFAVSYYGANIYPENVAIGLQQPNTAPWVTGKFVLQVRESADRSEYIAVEVELAPAEQSSGERVVLVQEAVQSALERLNSEFLAYAPADRRAPVVMLWPYGDNTWFTPGVKHRYTRPPLTYSG